MNKQERNFLLQQIRQHGKQYPIDPSWIFSLAEENEIALSYHDYTSFLQSFTGFNSSGAIYLPAWLLDFLVNYFNNRGVHSILFPHSYDDNISISIAKSFPETDCIAHTTSKPTNHAISEYFDVKNLVWKSMSSTLDLDFLEESSPFYDAAICFPPLGYKDRAKSLPDLVNRSDFSISTRDLSEYLLVKSCLRLTSDGTGVFIMQNSFTYASRSIYQQLDKFGLFVDAIISLPAGSIPSIAASTILVFVRRNPVDNIFMGELSPDPKHQEVLLTNLRKRSKGGVVSQGVLLEPKTVTSFEKIKIDDEIEQFIRNNGLKPKPMAKIATSITRLGNNSKKALSDAENAIYIPRDGMGNVVGSWSEVEKKAIRYIQIVIKPDEAIKEYLIQFFNSELGQLLRKSASFKQSYISINLDLLRELDLYLPEPSVQKQILSIDNKLHDIQLNSDSYRRKLWKTPLEYRDLSTKTNGIGRDDSLRDWIETLPFPLASILRAYHITKDVGQKRDHLFHFYEATAQFLATIMLSAYETNAQVYKEHAYRWLNPEFKNWHIKASFGNWVQTGRGLSKSIRTLINNKDTASLCLMLFGNPTEQFVYAISQKALWNKLNEACEYRNSWKGHGSAESIEIKQNRLSTLEKLLREMREIVEDQFSSFSLVQPGSMIKDHGLYKCDVKLLRGSNINFQESECWTIDGMDINNLYYIFQYQKTPIRLLPFLGLFRSAKTKQVACYFYNRIEKNKGVRYVSYHFGDDPEFYRPLSEIEADLDAVFNYSIVEESSND